MIDGVIESIQKFWLRLQLTWGLINDDRVPLWTKMVPIIAFMYLVSPIDILPDFLLGFGQLDDYMILVGGMEIFERIAPADIVAEYRYKLGIFEEEKEKDKN